MKVTVEGLGTIKASKKTLNILCIAFSEAGSELHLKHDYPFAKELRGYGDAIHKALEEAGYYNKTIQED